MSQYGLRWAAHVAGLLGAHPCDLSAMMYPDPKMVEQARRRYAWTAKRMAEQNHADATR